MGPQTDPVMTGLVNCPTALSEDISPNTVSKDIDVSPNMFLLLLPNFKVLMKNYIIGMVMVDNKSTFISPKNELIRPLAIGGFRKIHKY